VFIGPHWTLFFDGSSRKQGGGAGALLFTPDGEQFKYMVHEQQLQQSGPDWLLVLLDSMDREMNAKTLLLF
jgi:hypothetical protein